jgi:hypothetical protein
MIKLHQSTIRLSLVRLDVMMLQDRWNRHLLLHRIHMLEGTATSRLQLCWHAAQPQVHHTFSQQDGIVMSTFVPRGFYYSSANTLYSLALMSRRRLLHWSPSDPLLKIPF